MQLRKQDERASSQENWVTSLMLCQTSVLQVRVFDAVAGAQIIAYPRQAGVFHVAILDRIAQRFLILCDS